MNEHTHRKYRLVNEKEGTEIFVITKKGKKVTVPDGYRIECAVCDLTLPYDGEE